MNLQPSEQPRELPTLRTELQMGPKQEQFLKELYRLGGKCALCEKILPLDPSQRFVIAFPKVQGTGEKGNGLQALYMIAMAMCDSCNGRIATVIKNCRLIQLS